MSYSRQHATDLQKHLQAIARPYRCRKASLSHGVWNDSLRMVEVVHQHRSAAKLFHFMGTSKQSKVYLQPEEALFLMQCSLLQVFLPNASDQNRIPLAMNEAYSLWLDRSALTLAHLHVSQYLTRIGFILIRHRPEVLPVEVKTEMSMIPPSPGKRKRDSTEDDVENKSTDEAPEITPPITLFDYVRIGIENIAETFGSDEKKSLEEPWIVSLLHFLIRFLFLVWFRTWLSASVVSELHMWFRPRETISPTSHIPYSIPSRPSRLVACRLRWESLTSAIVHPWKYQTVASTLVRSSPTERSSVTLHYLSAIIVLLSSVDSFQAIHVEDLLRYVRTE